MRLTGSPFPGRVTALVRRERAPGVVVWCASAAYACLAIYVSVSRHQEFRSGFDLANFDQALWLLAQGEEPLVTQHGRLYWGDHFALTPLLLTPLYLLGGGPQTLLVVQALSMALVAPLLQMLARAYGAAGWVSSLPALLWLASPLTLTPILVDFHHVPLVAPAIVGSVIALRRDRYVLFAVLALLACFAKEDVPLLYVMLGVVVALEGRRRLGLAIGGSALALFAFAVFVFVPSFTDSLGWFARRFAGDRGDSLGDVAVWIVTHPLAALGDLVTADNVLAVTGLVLVTGGLCLLAPRWMLLGLPALAHNLLSAYEPQHALVYHYHVPVALTWSIAAAVGVRRLPALAPRLRAALAVGVVGGLLLMPVGIELAWRSPEARAFADVASRREAVALVPKDAAVAATPRLTPHLSHRRELYTVPLPFLGREELGSDWSADEMARRAETVRWVLIDFEDHPLELPDAGERVAAILPELGFRQIYRRGSVSVYVRSGHE